MKTLQYNETLEEIIQKRSVRNEADRLKRARERSDQRQNSVGQRRFIHSFTTHSEPACQNWLKALNGPERKFTWLKSRSWYTLLKWRQVAKANAGNPCIWLWRLGFNDMQRSTSCFDDLEAF
ncbi:hypothetical protein AVEN_36153-1 [Araneus ventricosus]|uniref:Uncharacterized protein n=1 Tax=Araneus ventricosus TaxID=182803 RepID=A0A4Y2EHC0_ARAVE|nr:hypothetical protein AVEN_36153-1 [Araneus ventricosus]